MSVPIDQRMTEVSLNDPDEYLERMSCVFTSNSAMQKSPPSKIPLKDVNITIGRAESNTVFIPLLWISREHAVLRQDENAQWVLKCLSVNDIIINNHPLTRGSERTLKNKDQIAFMGPKPQHLTYRFRSKLKPVKIEPKLIDLEEEFIQDSDNLYQTAIETSVQEEVKMEEDVEILEDPEMNEEEKLLKELKAIQKLIEEKEHEEILKEEKLKRELQEIQDLINSTKNFKAEAVKPVVTLIREHFKCDLCTKKLEQTIVLNCGHNFCEDCVPKRARKCSKCKVGIKGRAKLYATDNFLRSVMNLLSPWYGEEMFGDDSSFNGTNELENPPPQVLDNPEGQYEESQLEILYEHIVDEVQIV